MTHWRGKPSNWREITIRDRADGPHPFHGPLVSTGRSRLNDIVLLTGLIAFWSIVFVILSGPIASFVVLLIDR